MFIIHLAGITFPAHASLGARHWKLLAFHPLNTLICLHKYQLHTFITCLRRSRVFLVILSMAELSASLLSLRPAWKTRNKEVNGYSGSQSKTSIIHFMCNVSSLFFCDSTLAVSPPGWPGHHRNTWHREILPLTPFNFLSKEKAGFINPDVFLLPISRRARSTSEL